MNNIGEKLREESLKEKQELWMEMHGFYIHYNCHLGDGYIDCHTHGLEETHGHMDLQIIFPLNQKNALYMMHQTVDIIRGEIEFEGKSITPKRMFKDGEIITTGILLDGYPLQFKKVKEGDREVLRLLICDKNKILPGEEGCDPKYDIQIYIDTE